MGTVQERVQSILRPISGCGRKWWFPLVVASVSSVNALAAGTLMWCVGPVQASLYAILILSNPGIYGILFGPMTLCTGSTIAAYTYIHLMKTGGAEFVLEQTGLVGSSSLETAAKYGERYGMLGLFAIQVSPVPVPTAILVVTGMLSGVEEWEIYAIVSFAKYLQLVFGALVLQYTVLYDSETGEKKKIEAVIDEYVFGGGKKKEEEKTSSSTTEMTAKKQKKRA